MLAAADTLAAHLDAPLGRGHTPAHASTGAAGGAACGDLIRVSLALEPGCPQGTIADAGFEASGCGAVVAAGSALVGLVCGRPLLDAARIGADRIDAELGGLGPLKRHASELAADALHRALGGAARTHARLAPVQGRTLVAMSGGVDSAVAALLVSEHGEEALGVTLELWSDPHNDAEASCCSAHAVRRARSLAHGLGMPHLSIDLRAEFRAGVVEHWLSDHRAGLTPNPCVRCNGDVRLDAMLDLGERLGAHTLATGHYARLDEGPLLRVAADAAKDQSYVLSALSAASLARLRFPLGELHKHEVRAIALRAGLPAAGRRDSQDLCFLAGTSQRHFLARHGALAERKGEILDRRGARLGIHDGAHLFTVGQRRGLRIDGAREASYVLATDARANTVTVGPREALRTDAIAVRELTLRRGGRQVDGVRLRAHGRTHRCRLGEDLPAGTHARTEVQLAEAAERTAPGQLACLYAGELVVGHATVAR